MIKLKDILLEHPSDYIEELDDIELIRRKKKYLEPAHEELNPMKDFAKDGENKKYDLNLGAFVEAYQDFVKFMKKHKEVPDGNKKEWALQIREKVGQSKFNGYIGLFTQPIEVLKQFKKFEKLKNKPFHFTEGKK